MQTFRGRLQLQLTDAAVVVLHIPMRPQLITLMRIPTLVGIMVRRLENALQTDLQ